MRRNTEAGFWRLVDKRGPDECWPWLGRRLKAGYGSFGWKCRTHTAHSLALRFSGGHVPAGRVVMHTCDNPPCCNPAHLRVATQAENLADMRAKGRDSLPPPALHGEESVVAKLTTEQVMAIRSAYRPGVSQASLARRYGVGQTHISKIVRGESRAHG
jgi:hypothetical protein